MRRVPIRAFVAVALAVAVGLATAFSPWASTSPDGLERVAEDKGFLDGGRLHAVQEDAPIAGYAFPGIENERLATGLAGFVGTLVVFVVGLVAARLMRRPPGERTRPPSTAAGSGRW
jgi:PDGLE domain